MNILSLDPGKRTGWCYGWMKEPMLTSEQGGNLLTLEPGEGDESMSAMFERLYNFVDDGGGHIIYEDFTFRIGQTGADYSGVKIQGIIELYREWHEPFITFTKQSPATGKAFYSDRKLKELEVYWGHGQGHGRDATRHLLQWATFGPGGQYIDMKSTKLRMNDTLAK